MRSILLITQNLDTGGVQKSVSMLANELSKIYNCTILLFEENKPIQYKLNKNINIKIIPLKIVDIQKKDIGMEIFHYRKIEAKKIIDKLNPNLIFSYEDYYNILSLSIASSAKRIISCRISLGNIYTKNSNIHLLKQEFYLQNIQKLYKKADTIVCVSKFIKNELLNISTDIKAVNIYNGIDQEHIEKVSKQKVDANCKFILNVGRLHSQKGQKDLILAYHKVHLEIDEQLLIIGDGAIKEELQKLISFLNLTKKVTLLGNIAEPYHYMAKASFCIMPSHQEGFSNTVLEMMFNSAVLSAKYDGYDEILNNYENLFEVGDVDNLSALMLKYSKDKEKTIELHKSQKRDVEQFTIAQSMKNYTKLIKDVMHG